MPESRFVRLNMTETELLKVVLQRVCAGNDHADAVVLQRVLDRQLVSVRYLPLRRKEHL